jgi:hypothetical protein
LLRLVSQYVVVYYTEVTKGAWRMPWLLAAKKDVLSCDKLRGVAQRL